MPRARSEKSSARDTIILMVVAIVLAAYCVAFGLQTLVWLEARHWAHANSWINDVPQPLSSPTVADGDTQLKAFNYEFKVPWKGKSTSTEEPGQTVFRFDSGQAIIFQDPDAQADMLRSLNSQTPTEYQQFQNAFGGEAFDSNYAIYQAVYGASPAAISPFSSLRDAMRNNQLLIWKIAFGADASPGLHSIQFGSNRGWQFGDPSSGRPVALRLFDGRDRQFRMTFVNTVGATSKFSQADIDLVVESLQPVPIAER
jgi:hypothetical protein